MKLSGCVSYAVFSPGPVSNSTVIPTYPAPLTYSWLNSTQVFYLLLSFKLRLSFYLSFYCSLTFPSTPFHSSFWPPPVLFFDHSYTLRTCSSFFVFACECSLHVIFFVPCYSLHSFPLNVARDILVVSFTPISIVMATLYISNSVYIVIVFVVSSLAGNWRYLMLIDVLWHLLALTWHWLNFVELNLLPCLILCPLYLYWFRDPTLHSTNSDFTLLYS